VKNLLLKIDVLNLLILKDKILTDTLHRIQLLVFSVLNDVNLTKGTTTNHFLNVEIRKFGIRICRVHYLCGFTSCHRFHHFILVFTVLRLFIICLKWGRIISSSTANFCIFIDVVNGILDGWTLLMCESRCWELKKVLFLTFIIIARETTGSFLHILFGGRKVLQVLCLGVENRAIYFHFNHIKPLEQINHFVTTGSLKAVIICWRYVNGKFWSLAWRDSFCHASNILNTNAALNLFFVNIVNTLISDY